MRLNPDGTIYTFLVTDRKSGASVRVDDRTFDEKLHKAPKAGTAIAAARAARETELEAMSAAEVREIAVAANVEASTKAANVEAILEAEFPE